MGVFKPRSSIFLSDLIGATSDLARGIEVNVQPTVLYRLNVALHGILSEFPVFALGQLF